MSSSKLENVAQVAAIRVQADCVRLSIHARRRMRRRQIIIPEVEDVLLGGWHVSDYDKWSEEHESWNYAIEGWTSDERKLRVVISFAADGDVVVVTVIDIEPNG